MKACVYYDNKSNEIIEVLPNNIDPRLKGFIFEFWNQNIFKKILINISMYDNLSISDLKKLVGHSISTIHDAITKLENADLIISELTYINNKKKILKPNVVFVNKNPRFKTSIQKFFQGLWIDSKKTNKIIEFLKKNKTKKFTAEQISTRTEIPVDEVKLLLSNWDSITTRTLRNFMQETPFEKIVYYKGK